MGGEEGEKIEGEETKEMIEKSRREREDEGASVGVTYIQVVTYHRFYLVFFVWIK